MESIPCIDCLIMPVCRYKEYRLMLHECGLLVRMLYYTDTDKHPDIRQDLRRRHFSRAVVELEKLMNPSRWHVIVSNGCYATIISGRREKQ